MEVIRASVVYRYNLNPGLSNLQARRLAAGRADHREVQVLLHL